MVTDRPYVDQLSYVESIFQVCWKADYHDMVFWCPWPGEGGQWTAFMICSDTFVYASADAEIVRPEDLPLLFQTTEDLLALEKEPKNAHSKTDDVVATAYLPELYAARKRRLRPMAAYYGSGRLGPRLTALFNAAGPPREGAKPYDQERA